MKRIQLLMILVFLSLLSIGNTRSLLDVSVREDTTRTVPVSRASGNLLTNEVQPTNTCNYLLEKIYLDPTSSNPSARSVYNITYLDGFGRKLQEIQVHGSPDGRSDIVLPYRYGVQGRVEKEYLPYALIDNHGGYVTDAFTPFRWRDHGIKECRYTYTLTGYDNSPLDRVIKQTGPGMHWHEKKKGVTTSYGMNGTNEVKLYRVSATGALTLSGYYGAGTLEKVTVTDEDGKQVETFTDNGGVTVLVVQVESAGNRLETYSVYDDRGLLRHVLSPEASAQLGTTINETTLQRLAYRYDYDRWGRMIQKRLPGCDPVYLVYDKRDRLVMSQDGKQRAEHANKWSYSLYDNQNRVTETGEVVVTGSVTSHAGLQSDASVTDNHVPTGTRSPLQYTLYDNYTATVKVPVLPYQAVTGYTAGYYPHVTGLVTSVRTKVLGATPEKWLTTTTYYDDRCRVIQSASENLLGGISRVDMKHDFVGNVVQHRESHQVGSVTDVLESVNVHDDRGRLLSSVVRLNAGSPATTILGYDRVGRLVTRKLGAVTDTTTYNSRGWLTGKASKAFRMQLRYEVPLGGADTCYNGNVSEWEWQQGTSAAMMYGFTYDGVNRLKETVQKQKNGTTWMDMAGSYVEKGITYDRNGNIKTLQRTAGGTTVDNLVYGYTGNQLTGLTENVRKSLAGDVYSPGTIVTGAYSYDKNGNMLNDSRKVLNFSYNVLNLLGEVKMTSGTLKAKYFYLADGTKLRVRDRLEENGSSGFDYLGSLTYKKSSAGLQLESASFGDGVIRVTGSNSAQSEVNYFLRDHLGSVRVIVDGSGVVKERNDYYPFGSRHVRADYPQREGNRYKYNGKEDQVTGNLEYLDYGARMYDSGLGRWFGVDPKAERYYYINPYSYCLNNSLRFIDPDGTLVSTHIDEYGNVIAVYEDGNLGVYQHSQEEIKKKKKNERFKNDQDQLVGYTLSIYSFKEGDRIDIGSFAAREWLELFESIQQLTFNSQAVMYGKLLYALSARSGRVFDPKTYISNGSQISEGVYVSPRDLGNYAAGAYGRIFREDKGKLLAEYGAYNLSGNNFKDFLQNHALFLLKAYNFVENDKTRQSLQRTYGEAAISNYFQRLGYENIKTLSDFNNKYTDIWKD